MAIRVIIDIGDEYGWLLNTDARGRCGDCEREGRGGGDRCE